MEHTIQMHAVYIYIFFNRQPNATVYNRYFCVNKRSPRRNFFKMFQQAKSFALVDFQFQSAFIEIQLSVFLHYIVYWSLDS